MNEKHEYTAGRTKYGLAHPNVRDIKRIDGTAESAPFIFQKDTDYRQSGNMIEWLPEGKKPDENTPFFVNYCLDAPMEITDINPGSVIRTVVESVALEVDYLYAQMNQVYNAGFIDTATGKSLDLVVSLLGITRKKAGFATGEVTFFRVNEPGEVEVLREAHIYDGKKSYKLRDTLAKNIKKVDGTSEKAETKFEEDKDYTFSDNAINWINTGKLPDNGSVFNIDYTAYEHISIPEKTKVSTSSGRPENQKIFRTMREAVLIRNSEGKWEVVVPVEAMSHGKEGNVFAGALNLMPKPPIGIEKVINKKEIMNGAEEESDSELRERAKKALERAGKATLNSLKSAVQGVPGVIEVKIVDQPDGVPGIVKIVVIGGDDKEIKSKIEETRSAGIVVLFERPQIVSLDIELTIALVEGMEFEDVKKEIERMIRQYFATLNIDDDVIHSQIIKSALSVQGVEDVHNVKIGDKEENWVTDFNQKVEIDEIIVNLENPED